MEIDMTAVIIITAAVLAVCLCVWWIYFETTAVKVTEIEIQNERIPKGFEGYKIIQLSDLQNSKFPGFYEKISTLCKQQNPDIIVFTGDLIDRRKYNLQNAREFLEKISGIAPIYYVTGNHEAWCGRYDEVQALLDEFGIKVLSGKVERLIKNGEKINLCGVDDPGFIAFGQKYDEMRDREFCENLRAVLKDDGYNILLTHRPEYLEEYGKLGADLVFCGHAHGGQFRLPLIGALFAPHQGTFPKLTEGIHKSGSATEIINRGLGNGKFQFRTFNRPEITAVRLKCGK